MPMTRTSCPERRNAWSTSRSVRNSSTCVSLMPPASSGGTSVSWTISRTRRFLTPEPCEATRSELQRAANVLEVRRPLAWRNEIARKPNQREPHQARRRVADRRLARLAARLDLADVDTEAVAGAQQRVVGERQSVGRHRELDELGDRARRGRYTALERRRLARGEHTHRIARPIQVRQQNREVVLAVVRPHGERH